jgi:serine/threonine protein kinase
MNEIEKGNIRVSETVLGDVYHIGNYIDTFALGHYARVLEAEHAATGEAVAFKVMRPEHLSDDGTPRWEARAFINEADLLIRLAHNSVIVRLLDCGYVSASSERPDGGEIVTLGTNVTAFRENLYPYIARRWRPYLSLELLPRHENLFYQMKPNSSNGRRRLPTEEGIDLAMQFADFLRDAHDQRVVYLDHKLEHVYWDGHTLRVIDLNSSQLVESGTHTVDQSLAQDVHNLCVGILYPVFTGLSPQKGMLMPQPASQPEVEKRYADVNHLDFGVEPSLSPSLQDLLQQGARGDLPNIRAFMTGLERVAGRHGWQLDGMHTLPALREARKRMREGLRELREGQDAIRAARESLLEAVILDDINEDMEAELRRLLAQINHALNHRVIP